MERGEHRLSFDRESRIHLVHGILLTLVLLVTVYKATKDRLYASLIATCHITSVFIVILVVCDVTLRLCEILVDACTPQETSSTAATAVTMNHHHLFGLNIPSAVTIVVSALLFFQLTITERRCPLAYVWDHGPYVCFPSTIFSYLLLRAIKLTDWETRASSHFDLNAVRGLDYGTGMAYSYYYGYLRLVLPSTGTASKSIVEKIQNYEDNHNITFPVHRLFILIPSSAYIPPNLKEASYNWMESAHELEEEKRNRAGNIGRTYRNNVYKIYPGGSIPDVIPKFVVVEGASPLLTFYEVQKHAHPESAIYRQYKSDIVVMFYTKLYEILQNEPDTKDLCELIYYDDYDSNGERVNVAKIILDRMSKINATYQYR